MSEPRRVATLAGDVPVDALGFTLMHEHVVLLDAEVEVNRLGRWRDEVEVPAARESLRATRAAGVDTLVDLTAFGMGRDVARVRRIAEGTGLNVVVATGIYAFERLPRFFAARGPGTANGGPEPVEEFLVREIREGVADTGIRAGVVKCGSDAAGLTPDVVRMLRAAARAHRQTGVPISTHTDAASLGGRGQQELFRSEGVDLERVVIGHCGDSTDLDYLTGLMDAGSYIGMDRFGYDLRLPPERRLAVVAALVRRGYAGRMVLSHDAPCYSDSLEPATRERLWPDCSHRYIPTRVLPALRELGVGEGDIEQMTVRNPRDVLGRRQPY